MKTIGVLALQGAFKEHMSLISELGHPCKLVCKKEDLHDLRGLIIPGGESTTMSKLLIDLGLLEPLKEKISSGLPVMGTCAGLILLAKNIEKDKVKTLEVLNVSVIRNAYGRQLSSFKVEDVIPFFSNKPLPLVFIRAPYISEVEDSVTVLHRIGEAIVAVVEKNILALSFHPELTSDTTIHHYFIDKMCL